MFKKAVKWFKLPCVCSVCGDTNLYIEVDEKIRKEVAEIKPAKVVCDNCLAAFKEKGGTFK